MIVTFISQCEKKALNRTRRVLDAFADRIGDNTWQTVITQEGLLAVKKLLRKTATKNTAVSCHWVRSRSRSELIWVVGNRSKFNARGIVPTNRTSLNLSHKEWEQGWSLNEVIINAASIAGLFHDFGKANDLFQKKLQGKSDSPKEPYRHEWVSLRLFEALVKGKTDEQWLQILQSLSTSDSAQFLEQQVLKDLFNDNQGIQNPFEHLAPFAKLVAWLVVSHHRLPKSYKQPADSHQMEDWLSRTFNSHWNSANAIDLEQYSNDQISQNWLFSAGTPLRSESWQRKVQKMAQRAQSCLKLVPQTDWLSQRFVAHMSRLSLMLADHYYSSLPAEKSKPLWQDQSYLAFANTDKARSTAKHKVLKQRLDEHNIGVAVNAQRFTQNLPALKTTLPSIGEHRYFSRNSSQPKYAWQNKAYKAIKAQSALTEQQGFFGVNMASTGCGKTMANARIMYALADEQEGCRFSVALGLRTLTLQTGDAYRELLKLGDDELAVLIGSSAVKALHKLNQSAQTENHHGSESSDTLFDELYVSYDGEIYDGRLKHWLSTNPKLEKLISAPILVSTIDHLVPATDSQRGGKQIAPMLRLLSADLVLDEPDDFGLDDLPALCRLVNWAGMLGSRLLLSSATLPPSLIASLFEAYQEGRKHYNQAYFGGKKAPSVVCAWIDEYKTEVTQVYAQGSPSAKKAFVREHKNFVERRLEKLNTNRKTLRQGALLPLQNVPNTPAEKETIYQQIAYTLHSNIVELHKQHNTSQQGRTVSLGVVRIANIDSMIAVAKALVLLDVPAEYSVHLCVYHSQFPLALRSQKENRLDVMLNRHEENAIWQQPEIQVALARTQAPHNIFVVLGTSVVEVGRDHDYDWAIAEPSSLRSIIQLAGRVQRHRQQEPKTPNVLVLNKNIRALRGDDVAYCKPGFESQKVPLESHELTELIGTELQDISAIPRVQEPKFERSHFMAQANGLAAKPVGDFCVQEHRALRFHLSPFSEEGFFQQGNEASLWWERNATWSAEFIDQTAFRKSQPQESFVLRKQEDEPALWSQLDDTKKPYGYIALDQNRFSRDTISLASGWHWWFESAIDEVYQDLADKLDLSIENVSERFGEMRLRAAAKNQEITWTWHEQLGTYQNK